MAGRPLHGTVTACASGWRAEVPAARGSKRRLKRTFASRDQAERWRDAAIAALQAGDAPPAADAAADAFAPAQQAPAPVVPAPVRAAGTDIASVARAWHRERYADLRQGGAGREARVLSIIELHILPFFDRHGFVDGSDVTRSAFVDWLSGLAYGPARKDDVMDAAPKAAAPEVPGDALLTIAEAAALTGASKSTIKRDIAAGAYPGTCIDPMGARRIPVRDLAAAGRLRGPLRPGPARQDGGYATDVIADMRGVFTHIMGFGRDTAGWTLAFDSSPEAIPTPARPPAPRRRRLTMAETARLARHLHPVHQLVLWLIRVLGLRISEAYGITVADVVLQGERALVRVHGQGGRRFEVRDDRGRATRVTSKKEMKTAQSMRYLIAPRPLTTVITLAIEAFHTGADGTVRSGARLIPGLREADVGGQGAFRSALRAAAVIEGISVAADEDLECLLLPTPKDSRAGNISDLAYEGVSDVIRKRWSGHAAGSDVHHRHYILDDPAFAPMLEATQALEDMLARDLPDGLVIATAKSCTSGQQPALQADKHR